MMKLYVTDWYRVETHYPLDDMQIDTLYYLYQPLIGAEAVQLYMMLSLEGKRMMRVVQPSALSRLISFLSTNTLSLEKSLRALEAIGLLKTFVKHEHDMTQYVYRLLTPLSLKAFFKNQLLVSLLQSALSTDDFQKTVQYFKISLEDLQGYEEVTARFQDVFSITRQQAVGKLLKYNEVFYQKETQDIELDYDLELLYKGMADYQVNRSLLSHEDLHYIVSLAHVYSVDALSLAGLVKDAMESQGLNRQRFQNIIQKFCDVHQASRFQEVYHKQPLQYQTSSSQSSPLVLHMQYLDSLTPYELLKEKQGGKEPVFHDLMIVETLMVQLGLKPAVINVLIEYVLGKNNNRLSKRYCEAIGASWARKKIHTAMEAYHELMGQDSSSVQEKPESSPAASDKTSQTISSEELKSLLTQLKEGQL